MATVDIELYYDLDRRRWTTSAGGLATQPSLFIGQSNTIDFKVRFVQGGVPIELTNPSFIAGVKVTDDPLGDYLLLTTTGTKTGTGATTIYTFTLLIDSVELQAYLVGITPSTNSTAFEVRDTVNNIATLPAITCSILPDYTLTGATPAAGSGTLVVDSGATFTVHKTFAMPVDDGQNNYVLKTNGSGVGSWAVDSAGTGTVTNVAVTTANGVSGTVANPTASAAITIALGAITPTTGAFSSTTDATNSTTAPLKTAGGMAVARSLYVGSVSDFSDNATFHGEVVASTFRALNTSQTQFSDNNSNLLFALSPIADSVNYVAIEPSVAGLPPHIYAQGADTNIGLHLSPKGAGYVNIQDGNNDSKRLRFGASGNGIGIITTLESSSTTSQTITLPNATTATTLAGLQMIQTFSAAQTFSSTVGMTLGTDATNSTTGGTLTVTGGAAVSKKLFVGLAATIGGALTVGGDILPSLDNAYDIGQSSGTRFRNIYCVGNFTASGQTRTGELADPSNAVSYMKTNQDSTHDFVAYNRTTTHIPFSINAATSQTADLFHCYVNAVQKFSVSSTGTITLAGGVVFGSFTVSNFPQTTYFEAVVTDALSPVVGSTVNAGGSAKCKVMYNGSAKIVTAVL